jgi:pyruvate, water dikinase
MTGTLYIVQARPETVRARQSQGSLKKTIVSEKGELIVEGTAIGSDAATGKVRVIENVADMATLQEGEILVADMTDRKYEADAVKEYFKLIHV